MNKIKYEIIKKKTSRNLGSKSITCIKNNDEQLILKQYYSRRKYLNEKYIYIKLKDFKYKPKLIFFDDRKLILAFTDVGDSLTIYMNDNNIDKKEMKQKFGDKIKYIVDQLYDNYRLYHNDLRYKNICIDKNENIFLIDFELTSYKLFRYEKKYFNFNSIF